MNVRPGAGPRVLRRLPDGVEPFVPSRFTITPLAATIGAEVAGVDLRAPIDDELFAELDAARREWKVLCFRDQPLTPEQLAVLALRWGDLTDDTLAGGSAIEPVDNVVVFERNADIVGLENEWHSDGTFRPVPTAGTLLQAIEVPPVGGDTHFADLAAAYDNLPEDLRARAAGLLAVHDWSINAYAGKYGADLEEFRRLHPPVEQPVVIRHPDTGRPTLMVNRLFTREIVGLAPAESASLLEALCSMVDLPELQCRWRWEPGSIAFWDNLAVNHYGASDYHPQRRVMARATFFPRERSRLWGIDPA